MPAEQIFGPGGMGPLEFIADVVRSLAWPGLIGLGFVLYRRQLRRLLVGAAIAVRRLNRFKYGEFEAGVAAQQAAQEAALAPAVAAVEERIEAVKEELANEQPQAGGSRDVLAAELDDATAELELLRSIKVNPPVGVNIRARVGDVISALEPLGSTGIAVGLGARKGYRLKTLTKSDQAHFVQLMRHLDVAHKEPVDWLPAVLAVEHALKSPSQPDSWPPAVVVAIEHLVDRGYLTRDGAFSGAGRAAFRQVLRDVRLAEWVTRSRASGEAGAGGEGGSANITPLDQEDRPGPTGGEPPAK